MEPTAGGQQIGIYTTKIEVDVLYPPYIHGLTSPYKVIESLPLNVTCQASSNPPPDRIFWSPSGEGSVPSMLYFSSVLRNNSGTYSCTAQNTMIPTAAVQQTGINTSQIQIDVLYTATIKEFVVKNNVSEIRENSTLELYCHVDSNPHSAISLSFADVLISRTQDSHELIFNTKARCLNAGKYICSATNSIMNGVTVSAEVNLKVQCGPRLDYRKNISTMYYRSLKDNVAFEVHVIAYPEPTDIMWYHRGNKTDKWQQVLNQPTFSSGLFSSITVHLDSPADFGDYLVNMTNSFGIYDLIFQVIQESNCCTWKTPDTMENTNQTTLIVSGVLFSLSACLFVAALVLFIHSRKGICSGVSNLQADNGMDTRCHYEDVSASSSPTPEYEELSNGSEKQPGSARYLYTNTMHTSIM